LTEDKNILNYVKWASQLCSNNELVADAEEPPTKKICKSQQESLLSKEHIQILEAMTEDNFVSLMNTKRSKFVQENSENAASSKVDFNKRIINAVCNPNVLPLIVQNLLDHSYPDCIE